MSLKGRFAYHIQEQIRQNPQNRSLAKALEALKSGRIAAAGLDVFEGEPRLNPEYISLKNTFLLPHIGSATIETRTAMGMLALDNVDAILSGKPAPTLIRPLSWRMASEGDAIERSRVKAGNTEAFG